jgi:hypothetical protein
LPQKRSPVEAKLRIDSKQQVHENEIQRVQAKDYGEELNELKTAQISM